eukprot:2644113-Ditylum_brightwellii.AAC.1
MKAAFRYNCSNLADIKDVLGNLPPNINASYANGTLLEQQQSYNATLIQNATYYMWELFIETMGL